MDYRVWFTLWGGLNALLHIADIFLQHIEKEILLDFI